MDTAGVKHMVELGLKIAEGFDGHAKADIIQASNDLDQQLARLGQNATPEAKKKLAQTLAKLETTIHEAVIHRSVQQHRRVHSDTLHSTPSYIARRGVDVEHSTPFKVVVS